MIGAEIRTDHLLFLKQVRKKWKQLWIWTGTGNIFWKKNIVFFDGKFKRCRNFVTLTASVYHPLLKRQIPLAVMETEQENSENIALFWSLFNEGLQKVTGDDKSVFNPQGWCTDMAGANMNGLRQIFDDDALSRIKSCEFHFKESVNKNGPKSWAGSRWNL